MKLRITPLKVIRFDFNKAFIKNEFINFKERKLIRFEIGKNPKGENWLGVRWSICFTDKLNDDEIFGHLSEMRAFYEIENREKDKKDIKHFLQSSFINVEMYFQEHAPKKYNHITFTQPDFNKACEKLFALVKKENIYSLKK